MAKPNAISILKEDHARVRKLLDDLGATTERGVKRRQDLFAQLEMEVQTHTQIEEDVVYPTYREASPKRDDQRLYFESVEAHHAVDMQMAETKKTDLASPLFAARLKIVRELLLRHIDEEEKHMFPRMRELLPREQLEDLTERVMQRRSELEAMARPPKPDAQAGGAAEAH